MEKRETSDWGPDVNLVCSYTYDIARYPSVYLTTN